MNSCKQIVSKAAMFAAFAVPTLASLAVAPVRTFVASTGNDANACSRVAPCRTFGAAITAVAAGGEVIVLDTAGYGPVTITKAVSIIAHDGVFAGVTVPNAGTGILLNTANTTDSVLIRGLYFSSNGNANGVVMQNNCQLNVENCQFTGFMTAVQAGGALNGPVYVRNCVVKDSASGVTLSSNTGPLQGSVENCVFKNLSEVGVSGGGHSRVVVRDSSAYNCSIGFYAVNGASNGANAEVTVEHCYAAFNTSAGVAATAAVDQTALAVLRVSNSTIVDNQNGFLEQTNGVVYSRNNNTVDGNANNDTFNNFLSQR